MHYIIMNLLSKMRLNPNLAQKQRILTDPKFLTGVLLIIISITLTTVLIAKAKGNTTYYELTEDIAAGQKINPAKLRAVSARIESDAYFQINELPASPIAIRSLSKGELLPKEAISSENNTHRRQVVIKVSPAIPSSVKVGTSVEIWAVPQKQLHENTTKEAKILSTEALVIALPEEQNRLLAERTQAVEISVPETQIAEILEATNSDAQLVIVPKG
ncbi:hypothetical protein NXS08_00970 [Gleimia sp. 6138-11-ORH1]|uniref:hypothetical protein n=1 Tax=Gleimia sp. 6138-11-ORH1 TaxID=2973937 RepID=UPI002167981F|nr:hypothetical protein [Gleimia sp. 6138-11-ORH1]MCS4484064.1 hypothetical protein [Gleimia sp. 6138-11-ORH1]